MVNKFKEKLKENGQTIKWFFDKNVKPDKDIDLTYSGFAAQLNDYAPVSENVKKHINKYMGQ